MKRAFIRKHINSFAIALFLVVYGIIVSLKPDFLYSKDGALREFGIGMKKKTVIPAWLLAIVLAILSYFFVLYYLAIPKLSIT